MLGLVLPAVQSYVGLDKEVLQMLSMPAAVFFLYSASCALIQPKAWQRYLKVIAVVNLAYCLLTLTLMLVHLSEMKMLGVLYFVGEMMIIVGLVWFEWNVANRKG